FSRTQALHSRGCVATRLTSADLPRSTYAEPRAVLTAAGTLAAFIPRSSWTQGRTLFARCVTSDAGGKPLSGLALRSLGRMHHTLGRGACLMVRRSRPP